MDTFVNKKGDKVLTITDSGEEIKDITYFEDKKRKKDKKNGEPEESCEASEG